MLTTQRNHDWIARINYEELKSTEQKDIWMNIPDGQMNYLHEYDSSMI